MKFSMKVSIFFLQILQILGPQSCLAGAGHACSFDDLPLATVEHNGQRWSYELLWL